MTLRLYDTAGRSVREFVPVVPGHCGIYLCGATVQAAPHYGHVRSAVSYDIIRRWLLTSGYEVTFVRNVTDIDDKILGTAAKTGEPWWALSYRNERAFEDAYEALGCIRPTYAPRATGHIPEMVTLMQELIDAGHAYAAEGDVYFDVASYPAYGALSGQRPEDMRAAPDSDAPCKRDPKDFALWKAHKPGEPYWATPWGDGRPGWHLECSAMAGKYLGDHFDIHGGGTDLVFPHHENEQAQSRAAGRPFTNFWAHHATLNLGAEKMSKSVGNVLDLPSVLTLVRPVEARYYLVAPHYRSVIDYSEKALRDAAAAYQRLEGFVRRATERFGTSVDPDHPLPAAFVAAMDDDIGTPAAIAVAHDTVRTGNEALASNDDAAARTALADVRTMLGVLGLDPFAWDTADKGLTGVVDALVAVALTERQNARARKDFAAADAWRDQLKGAGVLVEDTPDGPRWTLADGGH